MDKKENPSSTEKQVDPREELVMSFINASGTKRYFCGRDGSKIKELNEAIEYVKGKYPDAQKLLEQIHEAETREATSDELKEDFLTLHQEILQDKETYETYKANKYPQNKLNTFAISYNEKLKKLTTVKENYLRRLAKEKDSAEHENEEAKSKNSSAKSLYDEYSSKVEKKGKTIDEQ